MSMHPWPSGSCPGGGAQGELKGPAAGARRGSGCAPARGAANEQSIVRTVFATEALPLSLEAVEKIWRTRCSRADVHVPGARRTSWGSRGQVGSARGRRSPARNRAPRTTRPSAPSLLNSALSLFDHSVAQTVSCAHVLISLVPVAEKASYGCNGSGSGSGARAVLPARAGAVPSPLTTTSLARPRTFLAPPHASQGAVPLARPSPGRPLLATRPRSTSLSSGWRPPCRPLRRTTRWPTRRSLSIRSRPSVRHAASCSSRSRSSRA